MSYKDLNVYQRAYKVAIDLHLFLSKSKESKVIPQSAEDLRRQAREILGAIAEGFYQKTPKAKRFYNFKALDSCNRILLDLDFLHDVQSIPAGEYEHFKTEYEVCAKQLFKLNQSILNTEIEKEGASTELSSKAEPVKA